MQIGNRTGAIIIQQLDSQWCWRLGALSKTQTRTRTGCCIKPCTHIRSAEALGNDAFLATHSYNSKCNRISVLCLGGSSGQSHSTRVRRVQTDLELQDSSSKSTTNTAIPAVADRVELPNPASRQELHH